MKNPMGNMTAPTGSKLSRISGLAGPVPPFAAMAFLIARLLDMV